MQEREEIEKRIEQKKKDLTAYLKVFPLLGLSEKERERVTNQLLDDISRDLEKLKNLK